MARFGGMGGVPGGRPSDPEDLFEAAVARALGPQIAASDDAATAMWGALANRDWRHVNGDTAGYSFRAAGDLVAAVRGRGDYMDWYCSTFDYGVVAGFIRDALPAEGWHPVYDGPAEADDVP